MARGPDRITYAEDLVSDDALNPIELSLVQGLEKIVDRAMDSLPRGDSFIYGIYQALSPKMIETLQRRYRQAGWGSVGVEENGTGAYTLVLHP